MSDFYDYLSDERVAPLRTFLRDKRFTSTDLKIPYRVINHWSELGLFEDIRETSDDSKWRRFSFTDIIWIEIIKELRKYGFSLEKISNLKEKILEEPFSEPHSFEYQIFLAMARTPVSLLVYEDGFGLFLGNEEQISNRFLKGYLNHGLDKSSFIFIDINKLVSRLFPKKNLLPRFKDLTGLSDEEIDLINFIRFNDFDEVTAKLHDGKLQRFDGKVTKELETDLIDLMKQHEYQRIEVLVAGNEKVKVIQTVLQRPTKHGTPPAK